jgi:two-component system, cell cycle sensor histidine kinase and response regulator CckA
MNMKAINFESQIQSAQHRLHTIQTRANGSSMSSKALQDEAIAEFSITLEELHVTTEELKAQNEELLASRQLLELERQRYQELFDFAPDGYLVTDVAGAIQQANHAATQMLNLRQDLLLGKPLIVFVDKADQTTFHTQLDQLIQNGHSLIDWEISLKPREKPPFPASISVSTIYYDPQGQLTGFRWLIRDLSQRKLHEQAIREQADLLNVATEAILVRNLDNQILFWNKGAERLYGWSASTARKSNIIELLYRESCPEAEALQNTLVIQNGEWQGELNQVTQSDQDVTVDSHWTLVRDQEGRPKSILIVNTDITEKKQLESHLFQCQREESLGTLSRGIAHDLNNILTPILGISQLLPIKLPSMDGATRQLMNILETSARRAINLVEQIQLFAGGIKGEQTVFYLGPLIADVEQLAEKIFPKSIAFHTSIDPALWYTEGNATQIHQVLMNLCVNARDAMPHGGTLSLSAKNLVIDHHNVSMHPDARLEPYVVITIVDTGIGIPSEIVHRIFEPFFTTKGDEQGSGLGLSIVNGVIKNHRGFVLMSSRVGRGSQFQIFLPALKTMAISEQEALNLPRGNAEFILVVDDEVTVLETTRLMLEDFGYQVLMAKNGIEAIALYREHQNRISAILMDMMMPSMDGETAIRGLRDINPQVKIIANSGLALCSQSSLEVSLSTSAFLHKPYPLEALLMTLHEVIAL